MYFILFNNDFFFFVHNIYYLATSSLIPYLTIHMQSIGLSVEEIAIVYLALPLTTFLAPPVSGTYNLIKWVYYHWALVQLFRK